MTARGKSRGGRPRNPEGNALHHLRKEKRYWICRGLGLGSYAARAAASNAERFRETLIAHGRDPAEYGDLTQRLLGGRPRTDPETGVRYRLLRSLGLDAATCSRLCQGAGITQDAVRRLKQGLPLRG